MKTGHLPPSRRVSPAAFFAVSFLVLALVLPALHAQKRKNPTSKLYVSDVSGEAMIDTGEAIEDLSKRSVYSAQGTVIETKRPEDEDERSKYYSTMVYSNGTGAFFDADTRVEVRRFVQEPFTPNRGDVDVEPSISQTQAFLSRGAVGLCTSKLVAGSNMNYQTPQGSVNIRGRKIVIESANGLTKISMLEGESTVRGGPQDLGGQNLKAGEQALIRRGPPGQPNEVRIISIPPNEARQLDDKVAMACMARKTVYFEMGEKQSNSEQNEDGDDGVPAFDDPEGDDTTDREIVPVEVIAPNLPVEFTISPATIVAPGSTTPAPVPGA